MNDRKEAEQVQARKAWAFFSVLAGMGQFAAFAARAVTSGKPRKYSAAYSAAFPKRRVDRPEPRQRYKSVEHQKAVAEMRLVRRMKRIRKAENLLCEKRRRQARQWERHLGRDSGYRQFKRGLLASVAATLHIPFNATFQHGDAAYSYSMAGVHPQ